MSFRGQCAADHLFRSSYLEFEQVALPGGAPEGTEPEDIYAASGSALFMAVNIFLSAKTGIGVTFQRSLTLELAVDDLERILLSPSHHCFEPADV